MKKTPKKTPKTKNLREPWKPGESGNPKGRPKGTPNRATLIRDILEAKMKPPEAILRGMKEMYPQFFERKGKMFETRMILTIRLVQKAIVKGDAKTAQLLLDYAYGKEPEKHEIELKEFTEKIRKLFEK